MIAEIVLGVGLANILYKFRTKDIRQIRKHWYRIMDSTNSYANDATYEIIHTNKKDFGYSLVVKINDGLSYEKLEGLKQTIQDNFGCLILMNRKKNSRYVTVEIISNPKNDLTFVPFKTKPFELFLGYDFKGSPVILNEASFPHLLIAGVSGTGKSRVVSAILTNLIHNFTENEVNIYMAQIKKADLRHFEHCPQTKMFARTLEETVLMFEKLNNLIDYRTKQIEKEDVENIGEYNQISKKRMKYIYLSADEFSFYMPDSSDDDNTKELKALALKHLKDIIMTGRSVGIFVICSLQRTTVDNIPSSIKSQMTRLTFRQISKINSNNVIESDDAVNLDIQEAVMLTNEYVFLKTAFIDKQIIKKYIPQKEFNKITTKKEDFRVVEVNSEEVHILEPYIDNKKIVSLNNVKKQIHEDNSMSKRKRKRGVIDA